MFFIKFFRRNRLRRSAIMKLRMQDAHALAKLHRRCFPRPWETQDFEAHLSQPCSEAYGLKISETLIGFLLMRFAADEAEMLSVAVDPKWQKLSCGERLMMFGFSQALAQGAFRCYLEVESANRPALRLYEKLGFYETGRRAQYYAPSKGGDAVLMARDLA
jgi:ribosomal-protein-alanine N-acetyltransferase